MHLEDNDQNEIPVSNSTFDTPDHQFTTIFDKELHSKFGKLWALSPVSIKIAYYDWFTHLASSPGKQLALTDSALQKSTKLFEYAFWVTTGVKTECCISPTPRDKRFNDDGWTKWPYNIYQQTFLLTEEWWQEATSTVRGVTQHHSEVLPFLTRQYLDMWAPINFPLTNPQVMDAALKSNGTNFVEGAKNFVEDMSRSLKKEPPVGMEKFEVGKNIAISKGKVIYQNRLIELIQYEPLTKDVYAEPILITPAWIMKYYILDLSPENSLVKYLVENNHTVFMISWKNPDSKDRDLGFNDYLDLGIMAALKAIAAIMPKSKVNAIGYCLGGTLLTMAAATLARDKNDILKTITLLASQVDFEEAGELTLFIDESQIAFIEDVMWEKGYLGSPRMAGAFDMLRSYNLIYSRLIEQYLLGKRRPFTDLMAWNADSTRMPYKMHSEYLRSLFLHNTLASGKFLVEDEPLLLSDINVPIFSVATKKDHISPWKSVYKIHLFTDTEVTFLLSSGGHNAGIISKPGKYIRSYQIATHKHSAKNISADKWIAHTPVSEGSWWPEWLKWLTSHSTEKKSPPPIGNPAKGYRILRDAPGAYILQK